MAAYRREDALAVKVKEFRRGLEHQTFDFLLRTNMSSCTYLDTYTHTIDGRGLSASIEVSVRRSRVGGSA